MKAEKFTLIDTTYEIPYEQYVEHCDANNIEPSEENSNDYWEYVGMCRQMEIRDLFDNLKESKQAESPCVITGTLGLWDGTKDIYPHAVVNLSFALKKCMRSADDVFAVVENGIIYVNAMHHDGTNRFKIQKLNKKGQTSCRKWANGVGDEIDSVKDYWLAKYKGFLF